MSVIDIDDVKFKVYYVHMISRTFLNRLNLHTTTVVLPHEYSETPFGCVGLYSFNEDKTIMLGIMSDGSVVEIKKSYFPQDFLHNVEVCFKNILKTKSESLK